MKVCKICKIEKNLNEFYKDKSKKDGLRSNCILCKKLYNNKYYNKTSDIRKIKARDYYRENKEVIKNKKKNYQSLKNSKLLARARKAKRRASLKRTLGFIKEVKNIYLNCPKGYEVDHIIPLNGKNVSGLHVPWNLQYLTPTENRSKYNKLFSGIGVVKTP